MKEHKTTLFEKHDCFDLSDDDKQKLQLRKEIKAIVDGVDEPDAQDHHILGLCYYNTLQNTADMSCAHGHFLKALEKDENYHIARLYSAHCYHDKKEFKAALIHYQMVDDEHIKQEFALWRYVKLLEQIGFCLYQLGRTKEARKYFELVLKNYQENDFDELIFPLDVYQCLDKNDEIYKKLDAIEDAYFSS